MFSVARSAGFASLQSQQSVLKVTEIENKHFFEKINFFYKLKATGNNLCGFHLFIGCLRFFLACLSEHHIYNSRLCEGEHEDGCYQRTAYRANTEGDNVGE